jgi:hypothetical protein
MLLTTIFSQDEMRPFMTESLNERIDRRATELWDIVGHRKGSKMKFWAQAESEIRNEAKTLEKLNAGANRPNPGTWSRITRILTNARNGR